MTLRSDSTTLTPPGEGAGQRSRRRRWRRRISVAVLVVVLAFGATTARLFVWPSIPALPRHADAIIELAGPGDRDAATISLARKHLAPIVAQSTVPGDATSDTCLAPIPHERIECFAPKPATTRGEARWIGQQATDQGWRSVIIVTTPDHAWRAKLRVSRCFSGRVYVATSPLPAKDWIHQVAYQWAATIKAELFQRGC